MEELQKLSVEVRDEDLANVATVSAGGNEVVSAACATACEMQAACKPGRACLPESESVSPFGSQ